MDRLVGKTSTKPVYPETTESDFLGTAFGDIQLIKLNIEAMIILVLEGRLKEANACLKSGAYLATISHTGSLEESLFSQSSFKPLCFILTFFIS